MSFEKDITEVKNLVERDLLKPREGWEPIKEWDTDTGRNYFWNVNGQYYIIDEVVTMGNHSFDLYRADDKGNKIGEPINNTNFTSYGAITELMSNI